MTANSNRKEVIAVFATDLTLPESIGQLVLWFAVPFGLMVIGLIIHDMVCCFRATYGKANR